MAARWAWSRSLAGAVAGRCVAVGSADAAHAVRFLYPTRCAVSAGESFGGSQAARSLVTSASAAAAVPTARVIAVPRTGALRLFVSAADEWRDGGRRYRFATTAPNHRLNQFRPKPMKGADNALGRRASMTMPDYRRREETRAALESYEQQAKAQALQEQRTAAARAAGAVLAATDKPAPAAGSAATQWVRLRSDPETAYIRSVAPATATATATATPTGETPDLSSLPDSLRSAAPVHSFHRRTRLEAERRVLARARIQAEQHALRMIDEQRKRYGFDELERELNRSGRAHRLKADRDYFRAQLKEEREKAAAAGEPQPTVEEAPPPPMGGLNSPFVFRPKRAPLPRMSASNLTPAEVAASHRPPRPGAPSPRQVLARLSSVQRGNDDLTTAEKEELWQRTTAKSYGVRDPVEHGLSPAEHGVEVGRAMRERMLNDPAGRSPGGGVIPGTLRHTVSDEEWRAEAEAMGLTKGDGSTAEPPSGEAGGVDHSWLWQPTAEEQKTRADHMARIRRAHDLQMSRIPGTAQYAKAQESARATEQTTAAVQHANRHGPAASVPGAAAAAAKRAVTGGGASAAQSPPLSAAGMYSFSHAYRQLMEEEEAKLKAVTPPSASPRPAGSPVAAAAAGAAARSQLDAVQPHGPSPSADAIVIAEGAAVPGTAHAAGSGAPALNPNSVESLADKAIAEHDADAKARGLVDVNDTRIPWQIRYPMAINDFPDQRRREARQAFPTRDRLDAEAQAAEAKIARDLAFAGIGPVDEKTGEVLDDRPDAVAAADAKGAAVELAVARSTGSVAIGQMFSTGMSLGDIKNLDEKQFADYALRLNERYRRAMEPVLAPLHKSGTEALRTETEDAPDDGKAVKQRLEAYRGAGRVEKTHRMELMQKRNDARALTEHARMRAQDEAEIEAFMAQAEAQHLQHVPGTLPITEADISMMNEYFTPEMSRVFDKDFVMPQTDPHMMFHKDRFDKPSRRTKKSPVLREHEKFLDEELDAEADREVDDEFFADERPLSYDEFRRACNDPELAPVLERLMDRTGRFGPPPTAKEMAFMFQNIREYLHSGHLNRASEELVHMRAQIRANLKSMPATQRRYKIADTVRDDSDDEDDDSAAATAPAARTGRAALLQGRADAVERFERAQQQSQQPTAINAAASAKAKR